MAVRRCVDVAVEARARSRPGSFVGGGVVLCNRTSVLIDWYTGSQCFQTGTWSMEFFDDGTKFARPLRAPTR